MCIKNSVRATDDANLSPPLSFPSPFLRANRAFDTLAKVLHPSDGSAADSLEATMQLMSGDQSGPVVELEGSLLSECHFPFKVNCSPLRSQCYPSAEAFMRLAAVALNSICAAAESFPHRPAAPSTSGAGLSRAALSPGQEVLFFGARPSSSSAA